METLKLVRDGLNGEAYFIDTIYGPYMTAMILFQSQPQFANLAKSEEIQDQQIRSLHEFQKQKPDAWHSALEAITQSTVNHIRHAKDILRRTRRLGVCVRRVFWQATAVAWNTLA